MISHTNDSIVLLGCKHCGKSTQGKLLADYLKSTFYDTDSIIEEISGITPRLLYAKNGPGAFMQIEEAACKKVFMDNNNKKVIATGGGICSNAPALNELRQANLFVFLRLDINFSVERIVKKIKVLENGTILNMPAYIADKNPKTIDEVKDFLFEKYNERFKLYQELSDITIDLQNVSKEENLQLIINSIC